MTATQTKVAGKLRTIVEQVGRKIEDLDRPRLDNTPKRAKEAAYRRIESAHLGRVRQAALLLADAHEAGTVPEDLAKINAKSTLEAMLRTHLDTSGGYYSVRDTGMWVENSATSQALRSFVDQAKSEVDKAADEARMIRRKIADAEERVRFLAIPGFFPTPPAVCQQVIAEAKIGSMMTVLEPSAGKGDLATAARSAAFGVRVEVCELSHDLQTILKLKGFDPIGGDFLSMVPPSLPEDVWFDRIVMNPPFEWAADIKHVQHAWKFLRPGGRLVSVMSAAVTFRTDGAYGEFAEWYRSIALGDLLDEAIQLPNGSFAGKDAFCQTGVNAVIVVLDNPKE